MHCNCVVNLAGTPRESLVKRHFEHQEAAWHGTAAIRRDFGSKAGFSGRKVRQTKRAKAVIHEWICRYFQVPLENIGIM